MGKVATADVGQEMTRVSGSWAQWQPTDLFYSRGCPLFLWEHVLCVRTQLKMGQISVFRDNSSIPTTYTVESQHRFRRDQREFGNMRNIFPLEGPGTFSRSCLWWKRWGYFRTAKHIKRSALLFLTAAVSLPVIFCIFRAYLQICTSLIYSTLNITILNFSDYHSFIHWFIPRVFLHSHNVFLLFSKSSSIVATSLPLAFLFNWEKGNCEVFKKSCTWTRRTKSCWCH